MEENETEQLRSALRALVEKLDVIEADSKYQTVWTLYANHGGKYSGPTYVDEINRAKEVLGIK